MKFKTAVLGGTFDRLHKGHKKFLTFASQKTEMLVIGLTSDAYVKKYKRDSEILSFSARQKELRDYLDTLPVKAFIVSIDANEIPAEYAKKIDAIISTDETLKGAEDVNKKRIIQGLPPLPIVTFHLITASDKKVIASTRIRHGEIDRSGKSFFAPEMESLTYVLPENFRKTLQKPIGKFIQDSHLGQFKSRTQPLITVGDITTKTFLESGVIPDISIIDFVVERVKTFSDIKELGFKKNEHVYHIENNKSTISPAIFKLIAHLFYSNTEHTRKSVIIISGEEDLIVLPVILLAPLGSAVIYGQPKVGMVYVDVTEDVKLEMRNILEKFDKKHA